MNQPILKSKLTRPNLAKDVLLREDLIHKLEETKAGVVVLSAPAGAGKTTLINQWIDRQNRPCVWYAMDRWDQDPQVFYGYLIAGMMAIDHDLGSALKESLEAYQSIGHEAMARVMIRGIEELGKPILLVLDDYHLLQNDKIDYFVELLCQHMPKQSQLCLISREDPMFNLAKLRSQGRMLEIRFNDLRFSFQETRELLWDKKMISLDEAHLALFHKRTEGWPAGVQLGLLSMAYQDQPNSFVEDFSGQHAFIMDYLMEEVLSRIHREDLDFLLRTAFLEDFTAQLCDHALSLSQWESQRKIYELRKNNAFLIVIDEGKGWYRYHHLFKEMLTAKALLEISLEERQQIHAKCGQWYEEKRQLQLAIYHYSEGNHFEEAARVTERIWAEFDVSLQAPLWLSFANKLPEDIFLNRPVLTLAMAWSLLDTGAIAAAKKWLKRAEDLYLAAQARPKEFIICDQDQYLLMPASLATAWGYIAAGEGELEKLFYYANQALEKTPATAYYKKAVTAMLLGMAHWSKGELSMAESTISKAIEDIKRGVNKLTEHSFYMVLGELYLQQGYLEKARTIFSSTLEALGTPILKASLYLGLAKVSFYQGDYESTKHYLDQSKAHGQVSIMDWPYKYYLLLGRYYGVKGQLNKARECLEEGRERYFLNPIPDDYTLEDLSAYLDARSGFPFVGSKELRAPSYLEEYSFIIKVFHLLRKKQLEKTREVLTQLDELFARYQQEENYLGQSKALVLKILILREIHHHDQARQDYQMLLKLADLSKLYGPLFEFGLKEGDGHLDPRELANQALQEPLTLREIEVLGLISAGYSNKEISDQLFIALSTVKGYNQNIYGKLGVRRRTEAIRAAKDRGLL